PRRSPLPYTTLFRSRRPGRKAVDLEGEPVLPPRIWRALLAFVTILALTGCSGPESASSAGTLDAREEFSRLERDFDARLGVYAVDRKSTRLNSSHVK